MCVCVSCIVGHADSFPHCRGLQMRCGSQMTAIEAPFGAELRSYACSSLKQGNPSPRNRRALDHVVVSGGRMDVVLPPLDPRRARGTVFSMLSPIFTMLLRASAGPCKPEKVHFLAAQPVCCVYAHRPSSPRPRGCNAPIQLTVSTSTYPAIKNSHRRDQYSGTAKQCPNMPRPYSQMCKYLKVMHIRRTCGCHDTALWSEGS